jgi:hypothetical protein
MATPAGIAERLVVRPGPAEPHCTTLVDGAYNGNMPTRTKTAHSPKAKTVRQSVTIPAPLAATVRRVAKQQHLTMSRALISLAERGVRAELDAKENLKATYKRFMGEQEPGRKNEAGQDLVRAIFGKDAIAEDSIL